MPAEGEAPDPHVHSAIDSIGRGTAVMVVGTVALLLLSFIVRVELARHLSLEDFGSFNLGLALTGLLALVALLGLHQATARSLAAHKDPGMRRYLIRYVLIITVVAAAVASSVVYFLAEPIASVFDPGDPAQLTVVFQMFSVTIGLTLLCTFLSSVFQGFEDTVPNAWLNQSVQPASFLVFVSIFFYFHLQLIGALVAWVLSNVVTFTALIAYTLHRLPRHLPPVPVVPRLPDGLWTLSTSLWGVTTLSFVTAYIDTLILGAFRPEEAVGIYSAVMTLARLILVASGAVTYIFLPVTARLKGEGKVATVRATYPTAGRWVLIFTAPMFLVFGLFPVDTVTTIFGPAFAPGALALVIIVTAALFSVALGPVNSTLAGMAMTRPLLFATVISAVSNVVLSFALIPKYGLLGAAAAWSVARILYPGVGALSLFTQHRISTVTRNFLLPLVVTLAIGIPAFYGLDLLAHPHWIVYPLYFVGVLLFIGVIFLTRSVEEGDLVVCRLAERAIGRPLPKLQSLLERFIAPAPPLRD
jgi:O-antigen/teichoic acid export membrane protein